MSEQERCPHGTIPRQACKHCSRQDETRQRAIGQHAPPPTDPTPTPTPREVLAKAMQVELDKHHDWDDEAPGRPVKGCGHHRLADGDFLKMADAGLAALAATGDAPLSEEIQRMVDLVGAGLAHFKPTQDDHLLRREAERIVNEAVAPLAAQLAALRATRDDLLTVARMVLDCRDSHPKSGNRVFLDYRDWEGTKEAARAAIARAEGRGA